MVDTGEAREYANSDDFKDGSTYTIGPENTHSVIERRNPDTQKITKRIAIGIEGVKLPLILNNTSRVALEQAWGRQTNKWAGKRLRVKIVQQNVRGTTRPVMYIEPATTEK